MTKEESYAVKQELKEYKFLIQRLEKLKEDRLRIEALAEKMTSTISGMPSARNNSKSKVEDGAIQLAEISMKYTNMLIESEQKKIEILNKISKTQEPYRNILERIYIYNDNLMEIALDYDWNYNYVCMQHMRALNNYFEKNFKS